MTRDEFLLLGHEFRRDTGLISYIFQTYVIRYTYCNIVYLSKHWPVKGASIKDVRKIYPIFDPPSPLCPQVSELLTPPPPDASAILRIIFTALNSQTRSLNLCSLLISNAIILYVPFFHSISIMLFDGKYNYGPYCCYHLVIYRFDTSITSVI